MQEIIELPFVQDLRKQIQDTNSLIQVVIGPRQVGKTTGVKQLLKEFKDTDYLYVSADGDAMFPPSWVLEQWEIARAKSKTALLIIDEVQRIEDWSQIVKKLWDKQQGKSDRIKLILLGSSSLSIQKGLSESLAGRFETHKVYHWNHEESKSAYNIDFEDYLIYGGYPGSYRFIKDPDFWLSYLKLSIIDPVIGKDILSIARVKSPALFRQAFDIVCSYPAQHISYTKLLGQLQDKGNTDLVKHYLELFEGAMLIKQLFKFSKKKTLSRSSSPKLLPLCPALYSAGLDADLDSEECGRAFELYIGASLTRLSGSLYYWRERDYEVDYVYTYKKRLIAIEVKSGRKKKVGGLLKFKEKFPGAETMVVTAENFEDQLKEIKS